MVSKIFFVEESKSLWISVVKMHTIWPKERGVGVGKIIVMELLLDSAHYYWTNIYSRGEDLNGACEDSVKISKI